MFIGLSSPPKILSPSWLFYHSVSLSDLNIVLSSESRLSVNYFSIHLTMWVWERNCLTPALNGPHSDPLMLKLTWVPLFISAARQISTQWIRVTKDSASKKTWRQPDGAFCGCGRWLSLLGLFSWMFSEHRATGLPWELMTDLFCGTWSNLVMCSIRHFALEMSLGAQLWKLLLMFHGCFSNAFYHSWLD